MYNLSLKKSQKIKVTGQEFEKFQLIYSIFL